MAKKYIYSEKKIIKEFLGSLFSKIIVNRNSAIVQNLIKNDPIFAKLEKNINKLGNEFEKDIERKTKQDPNYDKEMAQLRKKVRQLRNR